MMPKRFFHCLLAFLTFLPTCVFAEVNAIKSFPVLSESFDALFSTGFDTPEDAAKKWPQGYRVAAAAGRNGTSALLYEKTDPDVLSWYVTPLEKLVPGGQYVLSAWLRTEGIQKTKPTDKLGTFYIEYKQNDKGIPGTMPYQTENIGEEWQQILLPFTARPDVAWDASTNTDFTTQLTFYLAKGITGKIWIDDVEIRPSTFPPTILLTRPDRLSFFGDDGRFQLHVESTAPKNAAVVATISNGGKTRELLLKPVSGDGFDYQGDAGKLQPGPVTIDVKLADMDQKKIVSQSEFLLNVFPETETPENACLIDEYGRAIVDGKPFMPLGVFGFADEANFKRLSDAGFNCIQLYGSFHLRGNVDHKDDAKNILDGMDLLHKYGLKFLFSFSGHYEHRSPARKWGGAEGVDAVTEQVVRTIKDHPAMLAWYVSDEELRQDVPLVLERRRQINRIDPWHPTWTLTYRYDDLPYYGISGDTIGVDPYPIHEDPAKEQDIKVVRIAMDAGNRTGLPVWVVPQIFNWATYKIRNDPKKQAESHFPTLEEMRAMSLYAAMLGAKGFVFYSNFDIIQKYDRFLPGSGEREWAKVVEMVRSVKELEPFVLSTKKPLPIPVQCEPEGMVEAGVLLDDAGNFRIIVIGIGGKTRGILTLPEELARLKKGDLRSKFGKTRFLGENRYEFTAEAVDSDILE